MIKALAILELQYLLAILFDHFKAIIRDGVGVSIRAIHITGGEGTDDGAICILSDGVGREIHSGWGIIGAGHFNGDGTGIG